MNVLPRHPRDLQPRLRIRDPFIDLCKVLNSRIIEIGSGIASPRKVRRVNVREGERLGVPSSEADVESAYASVGIVDDDHFLAKESILIVNFASGGIKGGKAAHW